MKTYFGNYLGMVIDNNDPEYRGRVQIFIPHIMPTLYENWNQEGDNIQISCVGDNMPQGLPEKIVDKLKLILPWAESASPIVGQGIPGGVRNEKSSSGEPFSSGIQGNVFDQTPSTQPVGSLPPGDKCDLPLEAGVNVRDLKPGFIQRLNGLYQEATTLGYKITCSSGYRSTEKQSALYNADLAKNGGKPSGFVARPGGSSHEYGIAVDLKVTGNGVSITQISGAAEKRGANKDTPEWRALLAKYGLHQPLHPSIVPAPPHPESWHIEPIEMPKVGGKDRKSLQPSVAEKLSTTANKIGETTSGSQFPAIANPLEHKDPSTTDNHEPVAPKTGQTPTLTPSTPASQSSSSTTITSGPNSGSTPTSSSGSTPTSSSGGSQLAKDRTEYFRAELNDPQLLDRIEYLFFHQENKTKKVECGSIIFETAVNRAFFLNKTLKDLVFKAAYYAHNGTSTRPHTDLTKEMIRRVIYNGQNDTNLATDNASNQKGNPVAGKRVKAGCTGSWFDLRNGQKITDPGEVNRLTDAIDWSKEFLYRADGGAGYSTKAGKNAAVYAKKYNIQPTTPSSFNANTPLPEELSSARKSDLTGNEIGTMPAPVTVNNTDKHGPTIVKNTNDMAKGLFAFPGVGSMVWVFFREGNPLFPVYFAASYSSREWKSAYNAEGISPGGDNHGTRGIQTANSMKLNPNAGGGLEFTHIKDASDPSGAHDKAVAMIYGDDGSNMVFTKGYHQIYTRHDRRDQIDGHLFSTVHGSEERWIDNDLSMNVRGNVIIKVGKIDGETIEAMKELSDFSKQLNDTLITNSSK